MVTSYPAISYPTHYRHTLSQVAHATSGYQTSVHTAQDVEVTVATLSRAMAAPKNALVLTASVLADGAAGTYDHVWRIRTSGGILDTETISTNNGRDELSAFFLPGHTGETDYLLTVQVDHSGFSTSDSGTFFLTEVAF
jgi:hypothetical protein